MVNFSVFNELSLPFASQYDADNGFIEFFKILNKLSEQNLSKMRIDKNFKEYKVLENVYLQEFVGQLHKQSLKDRILEFLSNQTIKIETPLINDEELDSIEKKFSYNYFYNGESTLGGLACSYIWNTVAVSFNSYPQWDKNLVQICKNQNEVNVRNISKMLHIEQHADFFSQLEEELKLGITRENFWKKRAELFTKIKFTKNIEDQIKTLDLHVFKKSISILRDLETNKRTLNDCDISPEGKTVRTNPKLRAMREFYIEEEKYFFEKHIKNFAEGYRMHYLEKEGNIYIGYIGTHLDTKNN